MRLRATHRQGLEIDAVQRPVGGNDHAGPGWHPRKDGREEHFVQPIARCACAGQRVGEGVVERRLILPHQRLDLARGRQRLDWMSLPVTTQTYDWLAPSQ